MKNASQTNTYSYCSCAPLSNLWDKTIKIRRIDSTMDEICAKQDQYETSPFSHLMKKLLIEILIIDLAVNHVQIYDKNSQKSSHCFYFRWNRCEIRPKWERYILTSYGKPHRNTYYYFNCAVFSNLWVNMNYEYTYLDKQTKINALA